MADGRVTFGLINATNNIGTVCGTTNVLDDEWHHVAVQREISSGIIQIYVDGVLDGQLTGPMGDISYPDDGVPNPGRNNDPFFVFGAEKHDADPARFPSFSGFFDEVRFSNILRYAEDFVRPGTSFPTDTNTVALYHLDEGTSDVISDSSEAVGGPSNGVRNFGGSPPGPDWSTDTPFSNTTAPNISGIVSYELTRVPV